MGAVLICAVGNRDVMIDPECLPIELRGPQVGARSRGTYLAEHLGDLHNHIRLPILGKALNYVQKQHTTLDKLILVVSDQPEDTQASYRDKDTVEFGNLIKKYVPQHSDWSELIAAKNIWLKKVEDNPADFDEMRNFFQGELVRVKAALAEDHTYYLALSGGTPAMAAMLLFVGSDVFGKTCVPLYISDSLQAPFPLIISRQIYQQSVRNSIAVAIKGYNYTTAMTLLGDNPDEPIDIVDSQAAQLTIVGLLQYAHQRLAFDFDAAHTTMEGVLNLKHGKQKARMVQLWNEMVTPSDAWKLREVYFGADIKYRTGEYADFLGRIFRFHEGIMRFLAKRWGARFTDDSGRKLDVAWVQSVDGLPEWFANYPGGRTPTCIDYETRDVSRLTLRVLVEFLAKRENAETLVTQINWIERLADLRSKTVIAHNFSGISKQLLARVFTGDHQASPAEADRIVSTLQTIYEGALSEPVGPNPFDATINTLLLALLNEGS